MGVRVHGRKRISLEKFGLGPSLHQLIAGTVLVGFVAQGTLVITGILVARMLGPENRGYLALLTLVPTVLSQVGALGIPFALTYYAAQGQFSEEGTVRAAAVLARGQVPVAVLLQLGALAILLRDAPEYVWVAALTSLPASVALLARQYGLGLLQGQRRYRSFNLLRVMPLTVYAVLVLVMFAVKTDSLVLITGSWVGSNLVVGVITLFAAIHGVRHDEGTSTRLGPPKGEMLRFGLKGLFGSISPVEVWRLDQAIVALMLTPAALGIYVVGQAFTNLPRFVGEGVGIVAYPQIAASYGRKDPRLHVSYFLGLAVVLALPIVVILELWADQLVMIFFGAEYLSSILVVRITLLGAFLFALRRVLVGVSQGMNRPGVGTIAELASAVALVPLLLVLMPLSGIAGAAIALTVAAAVGLGVVAALLASATRHSGREHAAAHSPVSQPPL